MEPEFPHGLGITIQLRCPHCGCIDDQLITSPTSAECAVCKRGISNIVIPVNKVRQPKQTTPDPVYKPTFGG